GIGQWHPPIEEALTRSLAPPRVARSAAVHFVNDAAASSTTVPLNKGEDPGDPWKGDWHTSRRGDECRPGGLIHEIRFNISRLSYRSDLAAARSVYREPLWGAPRIHGELLKLGIEISQATVAKYMVQRRGTPSPTWRSFLRNQAAGIAAIDMFVVASASFRLLYVMIILAHDRRTIVRFDVTRYPTAGWLARQVTDAFPWDTAPRYLLRDRDSSYGENFRRQVHAMGITEVVTASRSPWQNAFVERVIGSIRRECLDYIVIFNARHLRRVLSTY